jgi:hypothetical protein
MTVRRFASVILGLNSAEPNVETIKVTDEIFIIGRWIVMVIGMWLRGVGWDSSLAVCEQAKRFHALVQSEKRFCRGDDANSVYLCRYPLVPRSAKAFKLLLRMSSECSSQSMRSRTWCYGCRGTQTKLLCLNTTRGVQVWNIIYRCMMATKMSKYIFCISQKCRGNWQISNINLLSV